MKAKIESDAETASKTQPAVRRIYFYTTQDIKVRTQQELEEWALKTLGVELTILDGQQVTKDLAEPMMHWIAEDFLGVPSLGLDTELIDVDLETAGDCCLVLRHHRPPSRATLTWDGRSCEISCHYEYVASWERRSMRWAVGRRVADGAAVVLEREEWWNDHAGLDGMGDWEVGPVQCWRLPNHRLQDPSCLASGGLDGVRDFLFVGCELGDGLATSPWDYDGEEQITKLIPDCMPREHTVGEVRADVLRAAGEAVSRIDQKTNLVCDGDPSWAAVQTFTIEYLGLDILGGERWVLSFPARCGESRGELVVHYQLVDEESAETPATVQFHWVPVDPSQRLLESPWRRWRSLLSEEEPLGWPDTGAFLNIESLYSD